MPRCNSSPGLFRSSRRSGPCIAVLRDDEVAVSRDNYVIISRDRNALLGPERREERERPGLDLGADVRDMVCCHQLHIRYKPGPLTSLYRKYLWKYGWIEPVRWDSLPSRTAPSASGENVAPADISSLLSEDQSFSSTQPVIHELSEPSINSRFIRALKKFQEANRLKVTGELDEATQEAMSAPRCGVPDRKIPEVEKNEYVNPTESATSIPYSGQKAEYLHFTSSATPIMPSSERIRREIMGAKQRIQSQLEDNQELGRHVRKKRSDLIKAGTKNGAFSKPTIKWRLLGRGTACG
ncbi:unnamed protein product [Ranitomeya imitator]|uniref:Peptidoglycan binding-like domain-containing protein n=1 Tax=Ranitomeya imitator TaxID=111125 RepID=A0ABN9KY69_9NEOB|nr:unnamed protein product [Ranitomeya imitator]